MNNTLKIMFLSISILILIVGCEKQEQVEKFMEDGVEVIVNNLKPYKIRGEQNSLRLEEKFTIDTEKDAIAEIGLTDIINFDVNSKGNIYFLKRRSEKNLIFKFDQNGKYMTSFGRMGEGPGEIARGYILTIGAEDEVIISDPTRRINYFDRNGEFKRYVKLEPNITFTQDLENGNYLVQKQILHPDGEYAEWARCICDNKFFEIKELDRHRRAHYQIGVKQGYPFHNLVHFVSEGKIYVGNTENGYEIRKYDLEGNLERRIKKEYLPVLISTEKRRKFEEDFGGSNRTEWIFFNKYYPPYQYLFVDDEENLFVMTYEEGENPGEYMYDVFNSEGIFSLRLSLGNICMYNLFNFQFATAKNKRLYCLREKDSGYKELVVYKMIWEY